LLSGATVEHALVALPDAVARTFPSRTVTDDEARELSFGRRILPSGQSGPVGAFAPDGTVVALLEDRAADADRAEASAKPILVFTPAGS
jgi:tRNA pseudouridine55 synthase